MSDFFYHFYVNLHHLLSPHLILTVFEHSIVRKFGNIKYNPTT